MTRTSLLAALLLTGASVALPALPAAAFSDQETSEIETIVRDYLIRNPEVLLEALDALEEKRMVEAEGAQREAIAAAGDELMAAPEGTVLGNPEGDVTIVEFFDYNCGFCKRAHADMKVLIEGDENLRFVLREIPVLGPQSEEASHVSLAVRHLAPERYGEFHDKLLMIEEPADETTALRIATEMGLDDSQVRGAMQGPEVVAALQENARLAALLNVTGTPSYVIGNELIPGAVGASPLAERIANVRECGESTC